MREAIPVGRNRMVGAEGWLPACTSCQEGMRMAGRGPAPLPAPDAPAWPPPHVDAAPAGARA